MSVPALLRRSARTGRLALALSLLSFGGLAVLGSSSAMAATTSLSITPCTSADGCSAPASTAFTPGGADSVYTTVGFDTSGGGPTSLTLKYAPGFLASLNADPSCVVTADTSDTKCEIGTGAINTVLPSPDNTIPFTAYLVPPTSGNLAGIEFVAPDVYGLSPITGEFSLTAPTSGSSYSTPALTLTVPLSGLTEGQYVSSIDLAVNGTLDGNTLTRLPTSCTLPAASSVSVTYADSTVGTDGTETGTASPDFTFASCDASTLPFSPTFSASAVKDKSDDNVQLTTVTKQAAGQAAVKGLTLSVPSTLLSLNTSNGAADFGKQVGTAYAVSPLVPGTQTGTVTLTGASVLTPELKISFPTLGISFTGSTPISPTDGYYETAFTYNASDPGTTYVPDVPLSELAVVINGGSTGLFETTCSPSSGTVKAGFTSQTGATSPGSSTVTVSGCATSPPPTVGKPTVSSASISGIKKGKPAVSATLKKGTNASDIKSFSVSLPSGLSYNKKTIKKGIKLSGGKLKSEKVSGSKLTITLKSATAKVTVKLSDKALKVSKSLEKKVKDKKTKSLTLKFKITNSKGTSTSISKKVTKLS